MQALQAAGLDVELEMHFSEFFLKDDEGAKTALKQLIDQHGLKSNEVMKQVGALQRSETIKPGIYKEFVELQKKLGGNGAAAAPAAAAPAAAPTTPAATAPAAPAVTQADVEGFAFTAEQEAKIKEQIEKEESKIRERLLKKEQQIRERMVKRQASRAQRLGLKKEEAEKIQSLKAKISANNEQVKKLREENKGYRDEIHAIRPKRARSAAASKMDPAELEKHKAAILTFVAANPNCSRAAIVQATNLDRGVYNSVMGVLRKDNKITKHGEGPRTNYTVA
jgi:hypothetical protein